MKTFLSALLATTLFVAPAFAASVTISFANDDGNTQVWTFDQDTGMATFGDISVPYTWDEAASTICATLPDQGEVCVIFESSDPPSLGARSAYTLSSGGGGTATVTAMTE